MVRLYSYGHTIYLRSLLLWSGEVIVVVNCLRHLREEGIRLIKYNLHRMIGIDHKHVIAARRVYDRGITEILNDQRRGVADPSMFVGDLCSLGNSGFDQNADLISRQKGDHLLADFAGDLLRERRHQRAAARLGTLVNI